MKSIAWLLAGVVLSGLVGCGQPGTDSVASSTRIAPSSTATATVEPTPTASPDRSTACNTNVSKMQSSSADIQMATTVWLNIDEGTLPFEKLVEHADQVCFASPFALEVTERGVMTIMTDEQQNLLAQAASRGVQIMPSVVDDWRHPEIMQRHLQHPDLLATAITDRVVELGYPGVDIDLESLPLSEWSAERLDKLSPQFTQFIELLAAKLHARDKLLSVAVAARTGQDDWEGARFFDYHALGLVADQIRVMAYDEHWGTDSSAGPTASLPFVNRVLGYAVQQVDPAKVVLGIPWYGYRYGHVKKDADPSVTWAQVGPELGQATRITRDDIELVYTMPSGQRVYYSDACATAQRITTLHKFLQQRGISTFGGVAIYPIGDEEPDQWNALKGHPPLHPQGACAA